MPKSLAVAMMKIDAISFGNQCLSGLIKYQKTFACVLHTQ